MDTCIGPECDRPVAVKKRGLCSAHNHQRHLGKTLTKLRPKKRSDEMNSPCPVPDCASPVLSRGLCRSHASVCWRMKIDPRKYANLVSSPCMSCGTVTGRLQIDHDHSCCDLSQSCGRCLRGAICRGCNMAMRAYDAGRGDLVADVVRAYGDAPPGLQQFRDE